MPRARTPARPCPHPRCPSLRPCATHGYGATPRPFERARRAAAPLYRTARWKRESAAFLADNPRCLDCGRYAMTVDHEPPHRGDERRFWDTRTWRPRCRRCHNRKTGREVAESRKT